MKQQNPQIYGLLGSGISYTLSPAIFRSLFRKYDLPHGYYVFDKRPKDIPAFVKSARLIGIGGFNVTIPFKTEIIRHLDRLHRSAAVCKSVNLVRIIKGAATGYNTDKFGIERVLDRRGVTSFAGKKILVVGAGGTGRAAVCYLQRKRARNITLLNRGKRRLDEMLSDLEIAGRQRGIKAILDNNLSRKLAEYSWDLIFNATPVPSEILLPRSVLSDADLIFESAYSHRKGKIPPGLKIVGGVDMLIYQALSAFELLTGLAISDYDSEMSHLKRRLALEQKKQRRGQKAG
jgi:shikimate dehydrogenase